MKNLYLAVLAAAMFALAACGGETPSTPDMSGNPQVTPSVTQEPSSTDEPSVTQTPDPSMSMVDPPIPSQTEVETEVGLEVPLSWSEVAGANMYRVRIENQIVDEVPRTSVSLPGFEDPGTYHVTISPINGDGVEGGMATVVVVVEEAPMDWSWIERTWECYLEHNPEEFFLEEDCRTENGSLRCSEILRRAPLEHVEPLENFTGFRYVFPDGSGRVEVCGD